MAEPTEPATASAYQPTSERLAEDHYQSNAADYLIYCCHLATYDFAAGHVHGSVLDYGCGTGYGSKRLAASVEQVAGVDISGEAIDYARSRYLASNLTFERIDPLPGSIAPFPDASFDSIVSFQVIEHIWQVDRYVDELQRLVRPGGTLVVATPDRRTRLSAAQRPWNLYHVVEYDDEELAALLGRRFDDVRVFSMTATPEVARIELDRTRTLRRVTYPFTFPHAPEPWRRSGLRAMKRAQSWRAGRRPASEYVPTFDVSAVRIEETRSPGLNLLAVARKP